MSEELTNNPDAMKSIAGHSPKSKYIFFGGPCGLFWFSACSFSNFNDWYSTLKVRFKILKRNWQKLNSVVDKKNEKLTTSEQEFEGEIYSIEQFINQLKTIDNNQSNKRYFQLIADIQSNLSNTNALIENIQDSLESRDERFEIVQYLKGPSYITSGINRYTNSSNFFLGLGVLGLSAFLIYKGVKK